MDKQKIISKIQKCLRLAESGNPNEAAAALRQAQGMMRKYRVSELEIHSPHMEETSASGGGYYNPPYWALALSELVAEAFDCQVFLARREASHPQFRYIGLQHTASVAAYSFSVLYRQLRLARRAYMRELALDDKQEIRRRGNVFAQAWLYRIATVVADFVADPDTRIAIDDYVQARYGDTRECLRDPTDPQARDYEVILSGLRAAHSVRLLRPVPATERRILNQEACA
jgi:hypothetical protein